MISTTASQKRNNFSMFRLFLGFVRAIGVLFVVTGISKVFVLSGFSKTITQFLGSSDVISVIIGIVIIVIEVTAGLGILFKIKERVAVYALCAMLAVFLWVLLSSILTGEELICQCFGILGISLPNKYEAIFDLFLLNILVLFLFITIKQNEIIPLSKKLINIIIPLIFVGYGDYALLTTLLKPDNTKIKVQKGAIRSYLMQAYPEILSSTSSKTIFFLRLQDFACPLCFDDYTAISDSLSEIVYPDQYKHRLIAFVTEDEINKDTLRLSAWKIANHIAYPTIVIPESTFTSLRINKSFAITFFERNERLPHLHTFPSNEQSRQVIFSAMRQK